MDALFVLIFRHSLIALMLVIGFFHETTIAPPPPLSIYESVSNELQLGFDCALGPLTVGPLQRMVTSLCSLCCISLGLGHFFISFSYSALSFIRFLFTQPISPIREPFSFLLELVHEHI